MKIFRDIYEKIVLLCPEIPPETGGILGKTSDIITHFWPDLDTKDLNSYDFYLPNTMYLNQIIMEWEYGGVGFCGIYHSHFPGGTDLSDFDVQYITKIMLSMPEDIYQLFFPLVFPKKYMIAYRADRYKSQIQIIRDKIELHRR